MKSNKRLIENFIYEKFNHFDSIRLFELKTNQFNFDCCSYSLLINNFRMEILI